MDDRGDIGPVIESVVPIAGGWCVKILDEHHCVDVLQMLANYRVVLSNRSSGSEHESYKHGWCYFGHGVDDRGVPRTMPGAKIAALLAAVAWDGAGAPAGYDKQAC